MTGRRAGDLVGLAVEEREVAFEEREDNEEDVEVAEEEDCGRMAES